MDEKDIKYESSVHQHVDELEYSRTGEPLIPPTEEDWANLKEMADDIPKAAYLVILIEFCERFTYYGLTGPFQNYIQNPAPESYPAELPGAMDRGQQTATALNTFFQFWCYVTPIIGAIVADQYFGKYNTILIFSCLYLVGLIILTATSIPSAIESGATFPGFVVSIIIIGLAAGGIKSNVSPLVAEQYGIAKPFVRTIKPKVSSKHTVDEGDHVPAVAGNSTEVAPGSRRVIISPQATYQKLFNMFYWGINVGSLAAITTIVLEQQVGFWAAYLLPTLVFIPCILTVLAGRKIYVINPPRGSIFVEAFKVIKLSFKHGLEGCKPSNLPQDIASHATWDDVFIDELRRTFKACIVFCWYPIYWLCYAQMSSNMVSMTATMQTGGVPNDIMQNINPLSLVIMIPIMDRFVYPGLRKMGIHFGPILRITFGFLFAALAMAYAAGIQSMIYNTGPYYGNPSGTNKNDISAGLIIPAYILIGISEIFANITGLEYAYQKAPEKMKSIVMALYLFTNCLGSVLGFALVSVAYNPALLWMYTGISVAMGLCAPIFYLCHGKNDAVDFEENAIGRHNKQQNEAVELEKSS
ncbi:POT family-domain-containing protein [Pilaira anomala]|nr:POT family-domain-containing protein [Pilaira anomala]